MAEEGDQMEGRHPTEALRKRESPREKDPRKEKVWGTTTARE